MISILSQQKDIMKKLNHKIVLPSLLLAGPFAAAPAQANPDGPKKNVLFIAVDDLKPLLGCYGDNIAKTPNIDELAKRGAIFTHSYCQQSVSGPTRASLLTGMCPDRTKVWDLQTLIRDKNPDVVTLPQHMKGSGYETAGIGKIYDPRSVDKKQDKPSWSSYIKCENFYNPNYGEPALSYYQDPETKKLYKKYEEEAIAQGVEKRKIRDYIQDRVRPSVEAANVPDDAYMDGAIALGAIDYINSSKHDKPFFLAVGFKHPHLPFCAPQKYWDLYKRSEMPLAQYRKKAVGSPDFAYHTSPELQAYTDIPSLISFSDIENAILPDDKARELIHGYYAAISYIDAQVGMVVEALRKKGLDKNTVIVLWGDHGWHLGDHGLWNKHTNFEQATHTPLIIVDPSIKPSKVDAPVEFLDIYPTLCDLTGVSKPSHLDGTSVVELMKNPNDQKSHKKYAVSQYPRNNKLMGYSIRDSRYRYTVWVEWKNKVSNFSNVKAVELYDYDKDPLETKNLVKEKGYQKALKQMEGYWAEYVKTLAKNEAQ
jgi:arylsulfatase A-like enzyme